MIFIGIDPGKTGGIASVGDDGRVLRVDPMPLTPADILMAICAHRDHDALYYQDGGQDAKVKRQPVKCVLEWVSASPQMGVVSAFTFGRGYGQLEAFLLAADIPFDLATPKHWQRVMQCLTGGNKNISKARAQALFPSFPKITHAIADALLIAEFCRRKERGEAT